MEQSKPTLGAERVARWLAKNGRDQVWLARRLDVAHATVSRYMSGQRLPLVTHCVAMESITGVPVRDWTVTRRAAA